MGNTTSASAATAVISAMLTPALLILASGSLAATALVRLARAIDRARALLEIRRADPARAGLDLALSRYKQRAGDAERALTGYFAAIAIFIAASLSIAVDHATGGLLSWLPITLTIAGMLLMLAGAASMLHECRLAGRQIRDEIEDG